MAAVVRLRSCLRAGIASASEQRRRGSECNCGISIDWNKSRRHRRRRRPSMPALSGKPPVDSKLPVLLSARLHNPIRITWLLTIHVSLHSALVSLLVSQAKRVADPFVELEIHQGLLQARETSMSGRASSLARTELLANPRWTAATDVMSSPRDLATLRSRVAGHKSLPQRLGSSRCETEVSYSLAFHRRTTSNHLASRFDSRDVVHGLSRLPPLSRARGNKRDPRSSVVSCVTKREIALIVRHPTFRI